jgi:F-type H+/Na+-transporting ATPase subunit alpha
MTNEQATLMATIDESGDYNKDIEAGLTKALENFKSTQTW